MAKPTDGTEFSSDFKGTNTTENVRLTQPAKLVVRQSVTVSFSDNITDDYREELEEQFWEGQTPAWARMKPLSSKDETEAETRDLLVHHLHNFIIYQEELDVEPRPKVVYYKVDIEHPDFPDEFKLILDAFESGELPVMGDPLPENFDFVNPWFSLKTQITPDGFETFELVMSFDFNKEAREAYNREFRPNPLMQELDEVDGMVLNGPREKSSNADTDKTEEDY